MARARKPRKYEAKNQSDKAYNARRRYIRAAKKYLEQAEKSSGATRNQYEELARQATMSAIATYDPKTRQKISSPVKELTQRFGIDLETRRSEFITPAMSTVKWRLIEASEKYKFTYYEDEQTRANAEAKALLKNTQVGKRILGGLVDVWRDYATPEQREQAIVDYFGVSNISEVIEKLEAKYGDALYQELENDEKYDEIKYAIQSAINRGNLVD